MAVDLVLGIDLAWKSNGESADLKNSAVVSVTRAGKVDDAVLIKGIAETANWMHSKAAVHSNVLAVVDAPLVVKNESKMRTCEQLVTALYVSAHSTNLHRTANLGGLELYRLLTKEFQWNYLCDSSSFPISGHNFCESYPNAVIVAEEGFGLCDGRRPKYKKGSKKARIPGFNCLISTLRELKASKPSLDVMSHCAVAKRVNMVPALLAGDINVTTDELKELEDILDALICAWVGLLWIEAPERCQLLPPPGFPNNSGDAVIVAPARHYDGLSKRRRKVFDLLHSYASSGQE